MHTSTMRTLIQSRMLIISMVGSSRKLQWNMKITLALWMLVFSLRCSFKSVLVLPKVFKAIWFKCDLLNSQVCWGFLADFSCHKILLQSTYFHRNFPQRGLSIKPVMPHQYHRIVQLCRNNETFSLRQRYRLLPLTALTLLLYVWPAADLA